MMNTDNDLLTERHIVIDTPDRPKGSWKKNVSRLLIAVLSLGIFFGAGYGTAATIGHVLTPALMEGFDKEADPSPVIREVVVEGNVVSSPITYIAEAAGPSIVTVVSTREVIGGGFFFNQIYESEGVGSGVIYKMTEEGMLVITNNHVINDAKEVEVILASGETMPGTVLGYDTRNDLALVTISKEAMEEQGVDQVQTAVFGDSEAIRAGEVAVAIGNPVGKEFSQTVTAGVISAVDRELEMEDGTLHVIQTDAAINPGNSGGALLNAQGEVIGINTAKLVDASVEGMGFAIPAHVALPIIQKIEEVGDGENVAYLMNEDRAYLGIRMGNVSNESGVSFGVYVAEAVQGEPAYEAGIRSGDLLLAYNGQRLTDSNMLFDLLTDSEPGDSVSFNLLREDQLVDISVTLGRYGDYQSKNDEKSLDN